MNLPSKMPQISELTLSTGVTEVYATSSNDLLYTQVTYYYMPFLGWLVLAIITIPIIKRLILEFIIRFRQ